jgi:GT2 family glycosyltransferase
MSLRIATVVLNWNGQDYLEKCLDSVLSQTQKSTVVVVDNNSHDSSRGVIESYDGRVIPLYNKDNLGFAGGVNTGIRYAIENNFDAVALLNPDAIADTHWLESLVAVLEKQKDVGIVTGCLLTKDGAAIDSTGELYSIWGLPFPRNRNNSSNSASTSQEDVFGGSGGASLYRVRTLKDIGIFDEDFFMYFEDVDISFRAQLNGWRVVYNPNSIAYHHIGASSGRVKGLYTYHAMKNWPLLLIKNVPSELLKTVVPRFICAYILFIGKSLFRGHLWYTLKGIWKAMTLLHKKINERRIIQSNKRVDSDYILSIIVNDLPENHNLRKLRSLLWRIIGTPAKRRGIHDKNSN